MPVTDGYEAIATIKSEMKKSASEVDTKIIALTAGAFEENRIKVMECGAADYVRKPFKEADIFHMMERHLGIRYRYAEPDNNSLDTERGDAVTDKIHLDSFIVNLPVNIISMLREAVELSDSVMIDEVIEKIRIDDPSLAAALSKLAGNFAYDKILDFFPEP
jgi:CheY-like chemotaxis protein